MALATGICMSSSLIFRLASNSLARSSSAPCHSAVGASTYLLQHLRRLAGAERAEKEDAAKKKKASGPAPENPRIKPLITLLSSPEGKEVSPLTVEELAAEAAYKAALEAKHQAWERDMTVKLRLQQSALKALPERLRNLAMLPDHTPFPMNRKFLFDTPPESYRDGAGSGRAAKAGGR